MAKTVFPTREVYHLWAHQTQEYGRNSGDSVSFVGPAMYSYRAVIGLHLEHKGEKFVLISGRQYSNTTSKHQSDARYAVRGQKTIYVPEIPGISINDMKSVVETCADNVRTSLMQMLKRRKLDTMSVDFGTAKRNEETGKWLAAYTGTKWKVPALPETTPETKEGREELVKKISRGFIKESMARMQQSLEEYLHSITSIVGGPDDAWVVQNLHGRLNTAYSLVAELDANNKLLSGKVSSKAQKILKQLQALEPQVNAKVENFAVANAKKEIESGLIRARKSVSEGETPYLGVLRGAYRTYPETEHKEELEKFFALEDEAEIKLRLERLDTELTNAKHCENIYSFDEAGRYFNRALRSIETLAEFAPEGALAEAQAGVERVKAASIASQAEQVAAWKAGTSDRVPSRDVGTLARINGDEVETNLGARVPLDHAVRLAKLAKRVIREGGRTYAPGQGFQVGHFKVQDIEATGRIVIGCHTFEPEEVARMIELLLTE